MASSHHREGFRPASMSEHRSVRYDALVRWCKQCISRNDALLYFADLFQSELKQSGQLYEFPFESIESLFRNLHLNHVKGTAHKVRGRIQQLAQRYTQGERILDIARDQKYPPALLARMLVEELVTREKPAGWRVVDAMRNPSVGLGDFSIIAEKYRESENADTAPYLQSGSFGEMARSASEKTRLAKEVIGAIDMDPMYGPMHDAERNRIGEEYEMILQTALRSMDIPFETEEQLRAKGAARTPDVFLSIPLGVEVLSRDPNSETEWRVVCWIDSKALFGDEFTHKSSVLPQAQSYVNRFGPGMVLYWFGHAPIERLDDANGDILIQEWSLPEEMLLPTGEFARQGQTASSLGYPST